MNQADGSGFVVRISDAELILLRNRSRALHVWCALVHFADWETMTCFPKLRTIAEHVGCSDDTVKRATKELQDLGLLEVVGRTSPCGAPDSNEYRLLRRGAGVGAAVRVPGGNDAGTVYATVRGGSPQPCGTNEDYRTKTIEQENAATAAAPLRSSKKRKSVFAPADFDSLTWPPRLDNSECRELLRGWLEYKAGRGESYKSTHGPQTILNDFRDHGTEALRQAFQDSYRSNWKGVFPPKNGGTRPNSITPPSENHRDLTNDPNLRDPAHLRNRRNA